MVALGWILLTDPCEIAVARSLGHAAATAHMADHALRAAEYALKATRLANKSIETEREWQDKQLTPDIAELVITARDKSSSPASNMAKPPGRKTVKMKYKPIRTDNKSQIL